MGGHALRAKEKWGRRSEMQARAEELWGLVT
jgi:hypothetical protein